MLVPFWAAKVQSCDAALFAGDVHQPRAGDTMSTDVYERIRSNPKFEELVAKRTRFTVGLSIVVLAVFYGFILVVALAPALLAKPLWTGAATTIAVPIGAGIIWFFWLLTGYYIHRANRDFDGINADIVKEAMK